MIISVLCCDAYNFTNNDLINLATNCIKELTRKKFACFASVDNVVACVYTVNQKKTSTQTFVHVVADY